MNEDWNGQPVRSFRSKGGVLALADPFSGVVRGDVRPWPPAELIQKAYKSEHGSAFGHEPSLVEWSGRYYCDLQSLHCEDALTWSVFGTLARPHRAFERPSQRNSSMPWAFRTRPTSLARPTCGSGVECRIRRHWWREGQRSTSRSRVSGY